MLAGGSGSFCRRLHFRCPACSGALVQRPPHWSNGIGKPASELACTQGHTVSVAVEGHVHLLPSGRKPRKTATARGDSDDCIRARRSFFDAGGYASQVRAVAAETLQALAVQPRAGGEQNVLDAGCGEGAYLRALEEVSASSAALSPQLWGTDLSKLAVRLGAKRQRAAKFAVSKSAGMPNGLYVPVEAAYSSRRSYACKRRPSGLQSSACAAWAPPWSSARRRPIADSTAFEGKQEQPAAVC